MKRKGAGFRFSITILLAISVLTAPASALPTGWEVVSGDVSFEATGNNLNVTSGSTQAIVHYQSFDLAAGETINFFLPDPTASILNRVLSGGPSNLFGSINSNGTVLLNNTAGINLGTTASINTGSFIASTLSITNQDYLNGNWMFSRQGSPAAVINEGTITTSTSGFVVLAGGAVTNHGNIFAPDGTVNLVAGDRIRVDLGNSHAIETTVTERLLKKVEKLGAAIQNNGVIDAHTVKLEAELKTAFYNQTINNTGVIRTTSATREGTTIRIFGYTDDEMAIIRNGGTLDASGNEIVFDGGTLEMAGDVIRQEGLLMANASEGGTGGFVSINSGSRSILDTGSITSASGGSENGDGGEIIVWSDRDTWFKPGAVLDVQGGEISGDGGFVEVSGKETVYFAGTAYGGATDGQAGSILIDPTDIVIDNAGGNAVTGGDNPGGPDEAFGEDPGATVTYDPQAGGAFNGFGDIHLQANDDITVNSAFDTSAATGNPSVSLILEAGDQIIINAPVTTTNADLTLLAGGRITLNGTGALTATGVGNIDIQSNGGGLFSNIWISGVITAGNNITITKTGGLASDISLAGASSLNAGNDIVLTNANPGGDDIWLGGFGPVIAGNDLIINNAGNDEIILGNPIQAGRHITATTGDDLILGNTVSAGGDIALTAITEIEISTNGTNVSANNNLTLNGTLLENPTGTFSNSILASDADGDGTGMLAINMPVNMTINAPSGIGLTLQGPQLDINNPVTLAGASNSLALRSSTNKLLNVGGAVDNADTGAILDISAAELARISAGSVTIGNTAESGNLEIIGAVDLTGMYDLTLNNGGNITSTLGGNILTGGGNNITINALGDVNFTNGGIDGGGGLISITGGGAMTLGGDMTTANTISVDSGSTLNLNAQLSGSDVTVTAGGDILDGNGALDNITATTNANVVTTGFFGSISKAIDVNITNTLTVQGTGMNAQGTAGDVIFVGLLPQAQASDLFYYDALLAVGKPVPSAYPGLAMFNGQPLFGSVGQNNPSTEFLMKNLDLTELRNQVQAKQALKVPSRRGNPGFAQKVVSLDEVKGFQVRHVTRAKKQGDIIRLQ